MRWRSRGGSRGDPGGTAGGGQPPGSRRRVEGQGPGGWGRPPPPPRRPAPPPPRPATYTNTTIKTIDKDTTKKRQQILNHTHDQTAKQKGITFRSELYTWGASNASKQCINAHVFAPEHRQGSTQEAVKVTLNNTCTLPSSDTFIGNEYSMHKARIDTQGAVSTIRTETQEMSGIILGERGGGRGTQHDKSC